MRPIKSKINCFCKFIKSLDMFGKDVSLFYEREEKKTSLIGAIFSILYIIIYIIFVSYKLLRMFKKIDVVFYDSFTYNEEIPSIKLSRDNFFGGFGLEDPKTYDPFIDKTIYYPKAFFKKGKRNGDKWDWEVKEIGLEKCKIENFGKIFQAKFNKNALDNLYCFKDMEETLFGHFSYDEYSFFFIQLFPCINSTENNNHCKPQEVIDYYLRGTFLCMEFEDIELVPHNYSYPIRSRNQDIYFTVGKKLFQEVHIFYQLVKIETDKDIFGFEIEAFQNLKEEYYLKYHSTSQMNNILEYDIYETGDSFCDITFKLYDEVRTQRRTYTKLATILGDIGGFMETASTILQFFISFHITILYNLDIINKLFKFKDNTLIIKKLDKKIKVDYLRKINDSFNILYNNGNNININACEYSCSHYNKKNILVKKNINNFYDQNSDNSDITRKSNISDVQDNNNQEIQRRIITKEDIKMNPFYIYFCFLCSKRKKNVNKFLMKEGMKIFTHKMDITNIFKSTIKEDILIDQEMEIGYLDIPSTLEIS